MFSLRERNHRSITEEISLTQHDGSYNIAGGNFVSSNLCAQDIRSIVPVLEIEVTLINDDKNVRGLLRRVYSIREFAFGNR